MENKKDDLGVPPSGSGSAAVPSLKTATPSGASDPSRATYPAVRDGDTIVVWFSCGAASAVAAKLITRIYGDRCQVRVVNNPIKQEDADNRRFLRDVERWIGLPIETAVNADYPDGDCEAVWDKRRFMSGRHGAPCTGLLKKEARQQWEDRNNHDWMVMGFTAEEVGRHSMFTLTERDNVLPILIEAGLTKADCAQLLTNAGIDLPRTYYLGYPNANCIGCVKATSPTYWNHVRVMHPEVFQRRAEQSREIGCRLARHRGKRLFLDELPADAKGRPMKSLRSVECGTFCEEGSRVRDRNEKPGAGNPARIRSEEPGGVITATPKTDQEQGPITNTDLLPHG